MNIIIFDDITKIDKKSFNIYYPYETNEVEELLYNNRIDLVVANYFFFDFFKELKNYFEFKLIFLDSFYDINHLKNAFEIGDDYLIKPVIEEELIIRIKYHLKNFELKNIIKYKDIFFHTFSKKLYKNNKLIKCSPGEIKLIELFLTNLNKPLSKNTLFQTINSFSYGTLRVFLTKIRKIGLEIEYNRVNETYLLKNFSFLIAFLYCT